MNCWCSLYCVLCIAELVLSVSSIKLSELIGEEGKRTIEIVHAEHTEHYFAIETHKGVRHTVDLNMLARLIEFATKNPEKLSVDVRKVPDKAIVAMHHKGELEDDLGYTQGNASVGN